MKKILLLLFIFALIPQLMQAQITGLHGWNITLDPGHSQLENMGIYNYSEAEKNLGVAWHLRNLLMDLTDIDTVYMTRTDSIAVVSLDQRTTYANNIGTAWFHSIHSDAGDASSNTTLVLWGQWGNGQEKTPNGGKAMGDAMIWPLTQAIRTTTVRGSIGDCTFYGCDASRTYPYLYVNRYTNMPSELSESGFHTNPKQNTLNMNVEYKKLEARALLFGILKKWGIARPYPGVSAGTILDMETNVPVNGAKVTLNNKVYYTDSYQSLFHRFTSDSTLLHNGFYYFESIPSGTYTLQVEAPGYEAAQASVTMSDTFFTFKDVALPSKIPPRIATSSVRMNDSIYAGTDNIILTFSRGMNTTSVTQNLNITPNTAATYAWSNSDKTLTIGTASMAFGTQYTLTIGAAAVDKYNHPLDGDGNGIGGDNYTLVFKTKTIDVVPPQLTYVYPSNNTDSVDVTPVITVNFDEPLKTATLSGKITLLKESDQSTVSVLTKYYLVNGKGAVNLFPRVDLELNQKYIVRIAAGIQDNLGNTRNDDVTATFTVRRPALNVVSIDNFESGIANWWVPQQSGSTVGIITDSTTLQSSTTYLNYVTTSTKSMRLKYGWDTLASTKLIRNYFSPSTPTFNADVCLETYIFGDGKGNKFRFCVTDQGTGSKEVSKWVTIDWIGWRLVSWDLAKGECGSWIGNGILEPPLRLDSYQLTATAGSPVFGEYTFDDLRLVQRTPTGIDDNSLGNLPKSMSLMQNYPNPFNPSTTISFAISKATEVTLKIYDVLGNEVRSLVNEYKQPGTYSVQFDARNLTSGVYFYKLSTTAGFTETKKLIVMK